MTMNTSRPPIRSQEIRPMRHHRLHVSLAAALALAVSACGGNTPSAPTDAATGMQAMVDEAAKDAADAGALPDGDAPLKEGQTVQGTIQADVGNGTQSFRSLSTKVADDIGKQLDEKLGRGEGQEAIADANKKLEKLGTGTQVSNQDVRDFVGGMAGKTFHDSEVRHVDIIKSLQVTLKGNAGDGGHLDLGITFDDKTLAMTGSSLSYRPKATAMFDSYQGKGKDNVQVTIDRFERNADGTYAIAGSFTAKDLPASSMAKKLPSATLPSASGTFSFDALPLKEMPKFGGG
jgi:hypothetical protein